MKIKLSLLAIIFLAVNYFSLAAEEFVSKISVEVGSNPVKVFKIDGQDGFHVICGGIDSDYDTQFDEGEELPSWWYVTKSNDGYTAELKLKFDSFTKFPFSPFRPGFDIKNKIMYIPFYGVIKSYNLDDFSLADGQVAFIDANGLDFAGGHLLIATNPTVGENGSIKVLNLASGQLLQTIGSGINLQEIAYFQSSKGISIAALCVGPFNSDKSTVYYGAINHMFDFELADSVVVGTTGNHLYFKNGKLYVTVNQSHTVKEIDIESHAVRTFHTGTSSYDGPRESAVNGNYLYVTNYSGDVRAFNLNTGVLENIYRNQNNLKPEGIVFLDENNFVVANVSKTDYSPNNSVDIFSKENINYDISEFAVGTKPLWMTKLNNIVHVVCQGNDLNNNGVFDEGDEKPSWWIIQNEQSFKKMDFEFGSLNLPFRPAIDTKNQFLFIPHKGVIKSYDMNSYELNDGQVAFINAAALDFAGGHLLIARKYEESPDSVVVLNLQNGQVLQKVHSGDEVSDVKYFPITGGSQPGIGLAVTTFNQSTGKYELQYGPINHMQNFELENKIETGNPYHLNYFNGNLIVTSKEEGSLININTADNKITQVYYGSDNQFGGTSSFSTNSDIYLSTLNGDVRKIENASGQVRNNIPLPGRIEYILNNSTDNNLNFYAASVLDFENKANNKVYNYKNTTASVADFNTFITNIKLYPNPTTDKVQIEFENVSYNRTISLFDISGRKIIENIDASGLIANIQTGSLNQGSYYLLVNDNNDYQTLMINVLR